MVDAPTARAPEPASPRATGVESLIEQLEKSAEGSGELSWEIALYLGWAKYWNSVTIYLPPGATEEDGPWHDKPPAYTTSLDAALTLRTKQYSGQLLLAAPGYDYGKYVAPAKAVLHSIYSSGGNYVEGYAKTLPLALCIAGIKARLP